MNSGTINISSCSEGIEASQIEVNDGKIDISMKDDGFNAVGESPLITVNGGDINITCETGQDSDGLDSNGSINLNGGNIFISIGGNGMDSAIDVATETGGNCTINGATVMAFAGQGMETSLISETQGIIMSSSKGQAGSTVVLKSDGSNILEKTIPYNFTNIILSSPEVKANQSYELNLNGNQNEVQAQSEVVSGRMGGFQRGAFGMNSPENSSGLSEGMNNSNGTNNTSSDGFDSPTPPEKPEGTTDGEQPEFLGEPPEMSEETLEENNGQSKPFSGENKGTRVIGDEVTNQNTSTALILSGISILTLLLAFGISFIVKGKYR